MKMNKANRLISVLLALLLTLSCALPAVAEEAVMTEFWYQELAKAAATTLYNLMLQGTTYEELLEATEGMTRTEIENFLGRLLNDNVVADGFEAYDAHIAELFATYLETRTIPITRDYTNVGPFLNYTTSTDSGGGLYALSRALVSSQGTGSSGLVSTKTVNWNETTSTGTITLEAYATGNKVSQQTTISPPLDIILIIDQTGSMETNYMDEYAEATKEEIAANETEDSEVEYYVADGVYWRIVKWCETCQAWAMCEHLSTDSTEAWTYSPDDYEFYTFVSDSSSKAVSNKAALIPAVRAFVSTLNTKVVGDTSTTADDANHRLAIIGYNSKDNALIYRRDTTARTTTTTTDAFISLQTEAGRTEAAAIANDTTEDWLWRTESGGTPTATATTLAYDILNDESNDLKDSDLNGNDVIDEYEKRKRVVILFTDGAPTDKAADAVYDAYQMKQLEDGAATVYTIGIMDGADPTLDFVTTSVWGKAGDRIIYVDVNAYMHFISSNYPDQQDMDESSYNAKKNLQGYYLAATSSGALKSIFQQIAGNIATSGSVSTTLDEKSSIVDVVTDYFQIPAGTTDASSIRVYTADCEAVTTNADNTKTYTFKDPVYDADLTASVQVSGNTVTVAGFDYAGNWCGTSTATDGTVSVQGKKLIIEIDIIPASDFIGGNQVVTNGSDSGVYANKEGVTDPIMTWAEPKVDVFVNTIDPTVITQDLNIYLTNSVDVEDAVLKEGTFLTTQGGTTQYVVNGVNNAYVDLIYTIYDDVDTDDDDECNDVVLATFTIPAGTKLDDGKWYQYNETTEAWEEITIVWKDETGQTTVETPLTDTKYLVTCTATPTKEGYFDDTEGEADANINVFTPVLTFQDSVVDYKSDLTDDGTTTLEAYYTKNNYFSKDWVHGTTSHTDAGIDMLGEEPGLTITAYTEGADTDIIDDAIVNKAADIEVSVVVDLDTTSAADDTSLITFKHLCDCTVNKADWECQWGTITNGVLDGSPAFLLHVDNIYGKLTIVKEEGTDTTFATGETFVFDVTGPDGFAITVVIAGEDSVTIPELPLGTYTVKEDTAWSWRYQPDKTKAEVEVVTEGSTVTFTNTVTNQQWLDGSTYADNEFKDGTVTNVAGTSK